MKKKTPALTHRRKSRARDVREVFAMNATRALDGLDHNTEIFGLTKGQFSLIDLICACLDITGPADMTVSTWTAAKKEIDDAGQLMDDGRVKSLLLLVDDSFIVRQPAYCLKMRDRFGDKSIRVTKNHAKFVLIRNAEWDLVLRSSMNLNKNMRLEFFEVGDDAQLAEYLAGVVGEIFKVQKPTVGFERGRGDNGKELIGVQTVESEIDWGDIAPTVRW